MQLASRRTYNLSPVNNRHSINDRYRHSYQIFLISLRTQYIASRDESLICMVNEIFGECETFPSLILALYHCEARFHAQIYVNGISRR